jgi:Kef-type K+ transport system membrane component KefB
MMPDVFTAAPHNDVLHLLVEFVILLLTARVFGEIAQRFGQSSVVGEILAGILLGPSFLSSLVPFLGEWIIPQNEVQGYLLEDISMLGIIFLLLITGLETDLSLIRRQARSAVGVAVGGLSVTLTAGFLLGMVLPESLLVEPDDRIVFAMFLAIAMAISAIPVIAKVLMDLNLTRRDVGQNIIASAMIDDTVGWILLSVVIGLASGAAITVAGVAESVLSVLLFLAFSFTVGQWMVRKLLQFTQDRIRSRDKVLTLVVLLTFTWGIITHALHLEALLGAFIMGILFSRVPGLDADVVHKLESIALGIFAPIFFAAAGLKVNILHLLEPRLLLTTVLITVVAIVCKVGGVYLGARLIGGRDHWSALFLGSGLNARGSMGIIVATIGLSAGVLAQDTFSIIVVMAVVTSLIAPAALRWTLNHIEVEGQELERLRKEELNRDNLIENAHRVLLPVRVREGDYTGSATARVEARILEQIGARTSLSVTLFNVSENGASKAQGYLEKLTKLYKGQEVFKKVVQSKDAKSAILDEAQKDYDLLVLGASDQSGDTSALFNPLVDELMRLAPCPTIVVRGAHADPDWIPRRILIPTNGTQSARQAAQVGFSLAPIDDDEEIIVLQVLEKQSSYYVSGQNWEERQLGIAHQIVGELREMGESLGIHTAGEVRHGGNVADVILKIAREENIDLIVMGTNVRAGSDHLYIGPKIERVLMNAPCPVMVVNSDS